MELSAEQVAFIEKNPSAAMITHGADGRAKAVRVGIGFVDSTLSSSGTRDRARTSRLRADPRCTLFVFDTQYFWLTLETTVEILDGPDVADLSAAFFRTIQHKPEGPLSWFGGELDDDAFRQAMIDEGRVLYRFAVSHAYGMLTMPT
jgi:hypothetical protein